jgi:shikimate O-hydroxycinnamoyltransferase
VDIFKESLTNMLVPFYPVERGLKISPTGRMEIYCIGEGVLLVEVVTNSAIDDFGIFSTIMELTQLILKVSYSEHISSCLPPLLRAVYFKCGWVYH